MKRIVRFSRSLTGLLTAGILLMLANTSCAVAREGEKSTVAEKPITADKPAVGGKSAPEGDSNDKLNVGDRVKVIFKDISPPWEAEMQIPESGVMTLHLGHKFTFKGKHRDDLEQEITSYYKDKGIYRNITVTIEVPARPISVGGEVRAPGNYPHTGQLTVLKAIDMAGGFTEFSKKTKVVIIRNNTTITVNCKKAITDPNLDKPVYPGDKIHVPRSL